MCNTRSRYYHNMKHRHPRHGHMPSAHFGKWAKGPYYSREFGWPRVNILEENEHYLLQFRVPGYEKEDFKVAINGNTLVVSAQFEKEENAENVMRKEFSSRKNFKREFELNDKINTNEISAEYKNGILTIKLSKKEEFHGESREVKID